MHCLLELFWASNVVKNHVRSWLVVLASTNSASAPKAKSLVDETGLHNAQCAKYMRMRILTNYTRILTPAAHAVQCVRGQLSSDKCQVTGGAAAGLPCECYMLRTVEMCYSMAQVANRVNNLNNYPTYPDISSSACTPSQPPARPRCHCLTAQRFQWQ